MTRKEALAYCERRWYEQCERFPSMRQDIPLVLYLTRNVRATMQLPSDVPANHPGYRYRHD
jgi:hypothetical protein